MIFVIDADKRPLDMCHPAKARKLLRDGKAAVYRRYPFTIILKKSVGEENKPNTDYRLKIDYGSRHTGLAILKGNTVCWLGQIDHRTDIKDKLDKRRGYRRRRRNVNLRYRKARFLNRVASKKEGWLPPSLMSRVNNIETFINRLVRILPLGAISYENIKFDTQLMQNPDICGIEYQQGELAGYEVREYLLEKFGRKCAYCGAENVPLEIEHIVPKARGGSNRISNLTIACHDCNQAKGTMTAKEFEHPEVQEQAKKPLKDAAAVTVTRWKVYQMLCEFGLPVECGTGGRTKYNRTRLGIAKDHCLDACCVGASTPDALYFATNKILLISAKGRGRHSRTNSDASGFPRGYFARQKQFFGFQTGDLVRAVVPKGKKAGTYIGRVACRKTGSFKMTTHSGKVDGINYRHFQPIQKGDGYSYEEKCIVERMERRFIPIPEGGGFRAAFR